MHIKIRSYFILIAMLTYYTYLTKGVYLFKCIVSRKTHIFNQRLSCYVNSTIPDVRGYQS